MAEKKKSPKRKTVKKRSPKKIIKKRPVKRKRSLKRRPAVKARPAKKAKENIIGIVTHYFPKVRAAVIKMKAPLTVGDTVKIKGHTTGFQQVVSSMQIDRVPIDKAKKGDEIGLLVESRVRQHDTVIKV